MGEGEGLRGGKERERRGAGKRVKRVRERGREKTEKEKPIEMSECSQFDLVSFVGNVLKNTACTAHAQSSQFVFSLSE